MAGYVIAAVDKHDLEIYQRYAEAGFYSIQDYQPHVAVAEAPEVLEGTFPGTTLIMMKFATIDAARSWYHSDAYQAAIPLRHAAGKTAFVIIFESPD